MAALVTTLDDVLDTLADFVAVACVGVDTCAWADDVDEDLAFVLFTVSSASAKIFWLMPHRFGTNAWHFLWQLTWHSVHKRPGGDKDINCNLTGVKCSEQYHSTDLDIACPAWRDRKAWSRSDRRMSETCSCEFWNDEGRSVWISWSASTSNTTQRIADDTTRPDNNKRKRSKRAKDLSQQHLSLGAVNSTAGTTTKDFDVTSLVYGTVASCHTHKWPTLTRCTTIYQQFYT